MITTLATVKTLARLYDISGDGVPTNATVATLGQIYMDTATGLTYELTVDTPTKVWTPDTAQDLLIQLAITRAEVCYLRIRNRAFDLDDDDNTVYPDGADFTAAEMVCSILSLGDYDGRGKSSEGLAGRSATYEQKLSGYPVSIVGSIRRFVGAK
jgi:outer membrane protein assembly factor BamB